MLNGALTLIGQSNVYVVVYYSILCLHVPFTDDAKTKKGDYYHHTQQFGALSMDAKKLLFAMFRPNPDERISIRGILHHPWFASASDKILFNVYAQRVRSLSILPEIKRKINRLMKQLFKLEADRRGQQPSLEDVESTSTAEMVFSAPSESDEDHSCRMLFNQFRLNEKGHISKDQFIDVLRGLYRPQSSGEEALQGIEALYRVMDYNGDGFIEFSEFETFVKEAQLNFPSITSILSSNISNHHDSASVAEEERKRKAAADGNHVEGYNSGKGDEQPLRKK